MNERATKPGEKATISGNEVSKSPRRPGATPAPSPFPTELSRLAQRYGVRPDEQPAFEAAVMPGIAKFLADRARNLLPERPHREFEPRRDKIIDYLRAPDGLGPWLDSGALTRPLLHRISPKAYMALANWLRHNELPADMYIPTHSESLRADAKALRGARVPRAHDARQARRRHPPGTRSL